MFYPQSWTPLITTWDLGNSVNNYGPIYPRHGFMTTQDGLKSAVLTTFRAAHVITRNGEPHLYYTIGQPSEDGYWPSGPLNHNDPDTGMFQMLYPNAETSCEQFPYSGDPSYARRSEIGSYVWNFWKKYKCCQRQGQTLLFAN
jgi:integrating conjugative element protein (TIGR03756 family)